MSKHKMQNKPNDKKTKEPQKRFQTFAAIFAVLAVIAAAALIIVFAGGRKGDKKMSDDTVRVKVEMENGGEFILSLYPEYAPQTVENFVELVNDGFYDGVGFHRVVDGFMAQGGDPDGTGMGGSGTTIKGEFAANGFKQNTLSHKRGVISMARSQDYDSASSQFFIMHKDAPHLDGGYAAFGKVVDGMDAVDEIADTEVDWNDKPTTPQVLKRVYIED